MFVEYRYSIRIDGVEHDHATNRQDAARARDALIYAGSDPASVTIVKERI